MLNISPPKTISPCPTLRSDRDKWGMGVRHALFPEPALGAPFSGAAGFPTPFSTASGVIGLVAGPSGTFQRAELLSEAFQLASAGGCATGLQTRSRHACDFFVRVLTTGSGSATAFDGAFAQNHGSRLCSLKLHFISQSSGVVFNIAGAWKFFTRPAKPSCSSRFGFSLCPAFRRLSFGGPNFFIFEPARVIRPC